MRKKKKERKSQVKEMRNTSRIKKPTFPRGFELSTRSGRNKQAPTAECNAHPPTINIAPRNP